MYYRILIFQYGTQNSGIYSLIILKSTCFNLKHSKSRIVNLLFMLLITFLEFWVTGSQMMHPHFSLGRSNFFNILSITSFVQVLNVHLTIQLLLYTILLTFWWHSSFGSKMILKCFGPTFSSIHFTWCVTSPEFDISNLSPLKLGNLL